MASDLDYPDRRTRRPREEASDVLATLRPRDGFYGDHGPCPWTAREERNQALGRRHFKADEKTSDTCWPREGFYGNPSSRNSPAKSDSQQCQWNPYQPSDSHYWGWINGTWPQAERKPYDNNFIRMMTTGSTNLGLLSMNSRITSRNLWRIEA